MSAGIYKITNLINNKVYIGSTISFKTRLDKHFNDLKKNKHYNKHLQSSFNKYGVENFKSEILREVKNLNLLIRFEQLYINFYNSVEKGYNKRKIADSNKGNKWTNEAKERLSNSKKGIKASKNQINSIKGNKFNKGGYKLSKEFKKKRSIKSTEFWKNIDPIKKSEIYNKISITMKGRKNPLATISEECRKACIEKRSIKINQYDLNNNFIRTWKSTSDASKHLNLSSGNIYNVLKNIRNHTGKFIFKYYEHVKLDKLLETPEEDNQQPIIDLND